MIVATLMIFVCLWMFIANQEGKWAVLVGTIWAFNVDASNLGTLGYVFICICVWAVLVAMKEQTA